METIVTAPVLSGDANPVGQEKAQNPTPNDLANNMDIGENPPQVMEGVIQKLNSLPQVDTPPASGTSPASSSLPASYFLRLPFSELSTLVMIATERVEARKSDPVTTRTRSGLTRGSSTDELDKIKLPKRTLKAGEGDENDDFVPPSARKRGAAPRLVNVIEETGEITNVIKRHGSWTHEEDQKLLQHVRETNAKDWKAAAREFPGKTASQCAQRWRRVLNPALNKGPISFSEEKQIMELKRKGLGWAGIGAKMRRVDLTIRYWWRKFKASHKTPFLKKEDDALIDAVAQFQLNWDAVYEHLKNIKVCPTTLLARTPLSWALRYKELKMPELELPPLPSLEEDKPEKPLKVEGAASYSRKRRKGKPKRSRYTVSDDEDEPSERHDAGDGEDEDDVVEPEEDDATDASYSNEADRNGSTKSAADPKELPEQQLINGHTSASSGSLSEVPQTQSEMEPPKSEGNVAEKVEEQVGEVTEGLGKTQQLAEGQAVKRARRGTKRGSD